MKYKTNTDLVTELMNYSEQGVLIQAFVLEALRYYSKLIINSDLSEYKNSFINPEAWKNCAEETLTKLENRHEPQTYEATT